MLFAFSSCARKSSTALSTDGRIQITLPDGWETAQLPNNIGKIQAKCRAKNAYVTIISEAKQDFSHKSIQEYADVILKIEQGKSQLTDRSVSGPQKITLNGFPALQYEVRGTLKDLHLIYVKTFVESPTRWNQIMCWTTPSNLSDAQPDFDAINQSFKENTQ